MREMRRLVPVLIAAVAISVLLGYLNLHNDEVELPMLILLLGSFGLGWLRPRRVWLPALVVGLGVPLSSLLALKIGVAYPCRPGHPYSCEPMSLTTALSTFVLIVPALVSAYLGAFAGRGGHGSLAD